MVVPARAQHFIEVTCGVLQASPLSCVPFVLAMDPRLRRLRPPCQGTRVRPCADDMRAVCDSVSRTAALAQIFAARSRSAPSAARRVR